jgi:hypothetical protein
MNIAELTAISQEEMLEHRGIKDESDAIADICLRLSIFYQEPDIDKFLDMPASRLIVMLEAIKQHEEEIRRRMKHGGD